ncbi:MAG: VTT domain-containing protein [Methanocellales archaeon]
MQLNSTVEWLFNLTIDLGYIGIFTASFLGNLFLFIPLPYLIIVFLLSNPIFGFNPILLAITSALGASIAKLITYTIGYGSRHLLTEQRCRKLEYARWLVGRHGILIIFLFAATPLPDDALYIPLGMMSYSFFKFFTSVLAGKIVLTLIVSYSGYYSLEWLMFLLNGGSWLGVVITIVFIALSIYLTLRIDWEKICLTFFSDKLEGLKYLLDELDKKNRI